MQFDDFNRNELELSAVQKLLVLIFFLFISLILISSQVILKNKQSLLVYVLAEIISPFQNLTQNTVSYIDNKMERFFFLSDIYQRYKSLQIKYRQLLQDYYSLKGEFWPEKLRQASARSDLRQVAIIYRDQNFPFEYVVINCGKKDQVKADMVVVNQDLEIVGRVVEPVTTNSSRVLLLTSSRSAIGAFVEGELLEGLLQGKGQKLCEFEYLIEDRNIREGVTLVTSGSDAIFPPFYPVGKVVQVAKGSYLTLKIKVEPFFLKKSMKYLYLLTGQNEKDKN